MSDTLKSLTNIIKSTIARQEMEAAKGSKEADFINTALKAAGKTAVSGALGAPVEAVSFAQRVLFPSAEDKPITESADLPYGQRDIHKKLFDEDPQNIDDATGAVLAGQVVAGFASLGKKPPIELTKKFSQRGMIVAAARKPGGGYGAVKYKDADGKLKSLISDSGATVSHKNLPSGPGDASKLENVLSHPELYSLYPELKSMPVMREFSSDRRGSFDPNTKRIRIKTEMPADQLRATLLHESQHAIQNLEGFTQGTNAGAFINFDVSRIQKRVTEAMQSSDPSVREAAQRLKSSTNKKLQEANLKYNNNAGEQEARFTETFSDRSQKDIDLTLQKLLSNNLSPQTWDTK
ncbi:MAG: DUF6782 family putative metallopeptidase [Waterburya sp.]